MKSLILAALATALVPTATLGQDSADAKSKKEKKICKTYKVTGSLTRVNRICMTQAEWDEQQRRTKQGLDDFNRGAAGGANHGYDVSAATQVGN